MKLKEMHRRIRDALQAGPDYPMSVRDFELTAHELGVLRALVCLLEDETGALLPYTLSSTAKDEHRVTPDTFSQYCQGIEAHVLALKWALLLHDVSKDREATGAHPEQSAGIVEQLGTAIQEITPILSSRDLERVIWLVRYHDVLGNIYTGERAPSYLFKITEGMAPDERETRLRLLQIVTLCDMLGTKDGQYLTEDKASFWLRLSDEKAIDELDAQLFETRIARWTGDLLGIENKERAHRLLDMIEQSGYATEIKRVFRENIDYIVYGFYLFIALSDDSLENVFKLMRKTAVAYGNAFTDNRKVTLRFTPYKPWETSTQVVLDHYITHIQSCKLRFEFDKDRGVISIPIRPKTP